MPILIRFNTDHVRDNSLPKWRVYINGEYFCVDEVHINVPSFTSTDYDENAKQLKHHICVDDSDFKIFTREKIGSSDIITIN